MPLPATSEPSARPQSGGYFTDSYVFNWHNQTFRDDLVLLPAIAICLGAGVALGHPAAGMIAGGGAMTVGFGAKQSIDDSRLLPMLFVSIGMTFAAFLGVIIGYTNYLLVPIAALWAFGYGMLTTREEGYSWVGQQCVITFLVASAFPASLGPACNRALLILAGGTIQLAFSAILLRLFRQLGGHLASLAQYVHAEQLALRSAYLMATQSILGRRFLSSAIPYSLRLAVTLAVTTEIYRRMNFPSGYWIPMTALLVLKPGITDTVSRAIARLVGTFAAAIVVSSCLAQLPSPSPTVLAAFTLIFAWFSYGTNNVNYALFSVCITGYIVFLLSINNVPGPLVAQRRAISTAIGGSIALAVRLIVIYRRKKELKKSGAALPQST
ncbi:FUSC family protein [Alloacidobacterium dinghuense]|uniref:FUSC family protein n=1 Tax=Alloacidobacterium dinghuense TaxID=2763107 RepID=A0A7G8BDW6_9BACT|nr:FUSC family protein [Alloacidobacterium dinghuense]QNI30736.1 FUSC family protein [Alloacidobacterium dinghuense]